MQQGDPVLLLGNVVALVEIGIERHGRRSSMIESLPPRQPTRTRSHRRPLQQGAVAPLVKSSWLKVSAEKPRFVSVAGGCLSVFIPSYSPRRAKIGVNSQTFLCKQR